MESGEDYHMKGMGMLIVLLMGPYHRFWSYSGYVSLRHLFLRVACHHSVLVF